uniref:bacteriophage T4 gp5 trimerisation domain-containing protein n=1 Tax=Tritonibacter mobilis TaxID=379347 RepID=UPI000B338510
ELPKHKTRSTFKTDTHQGKGFNELRFEDQSGKEEIFIHAERDRNEKIRHNHTERIDNNWVQSVGRSKVTEISHDAVQQIGGSAQITVGTISKGKLIRPEFTTDPEGIKGIASELDAADALSTESGRFTLKVEKSVNISTGGSFVETVETEKRISSNDRVAIGSTNLTEISSADVVSVYAGKEFSIVCGAANLRFTDDGKITINGTSIDITALNDVKIKAGKIDLN